MRLVACYANLMLISLFLGLGVGAMLARRRKTLFERLPILLFANVLFLLFAQFLTFPTTGTEHRFCARGSQWLNYCTLIGIFLANAIVFVPLGERVGVLFERCRRWRPMDGTWEAVWRGHCVLASFHSPRFRPRWGWGSFRWLF